MVWMKLYERTLHQNYCFLRIVHFAVMHFQIPKPWWQCVVVLLWILENVEVKIDDYLAYLWRYNQKLALELWRWRKMTNTFFFSALWIKEIKTFHKMIQRQTLFLSSNGKSCLLRAVVVILYTVFTVFF